MSHTLTSEIASSLDPIIITSPTIRSGTTLLQRLLCSSRNALIYGEECGKDMELMMQLYAAKIATYSQSRQRSSVSLQKVLEGDVNDWILDLMPDMDGYMESLGRSYFSGLAYCRDYAIQVGRPVWGIKYPGWSPHFIKLIHQVMPKTRFVIMYRNITDCLRSAKARRSVVSEQEAQQFCRTWTYNLAFMLGMRTDPAVLLVEYAELVTAPEKTIEMIAGFTHIQDMRKEILSYKINNWVDVENQALNQSNYIEPVDLTKAEKSMADEALSELGKSAPDISARFSS
jgi:hypothetical protein